MAVRPVTQGNEAGELEGLPCHRHFNCLYMWVC